MGFQKALNMIEITVIMKMCSVLLKYNFLLR